jgi:5-methylcytosine-specific restriction endonuclease McrA
MSTFNFDEMTKAEIIKAIEELDAAIDQEGLKEAKDPDPGHNLYRAVMWLTCMSCGNRYVDPDDCAICRPSKKFLDKWREQYPWKSDQKGPSLEPASRDTISNPRG